jgi:diacylglycerol O-acyltransferase / wax synthase
MQWFAQESPATPMHGGLVLHYAGSISRSELIELLRARLPLVPRLGQKIVPAPFVIAMPSWQDDPSFDLADHVKELTLPAPADDRVLGEVIGELHSARIDRTRPLWTATLLHGRPNRTVLYFNAHHAMMDAPAMMELLPVLHDPQPDAEVLPAAAASNPKLARKPIDEIASAVADRTSALLELGTGLTAGLRPDKLLAQAQQMGGLASLGLDLLKPLQTMPWNGTLSAQRRIAWTQVSFKEFRQLSKEVDATVNDLVMTVIAGGLARYLRLHGRATTGLELRDMVTVSVRQPEERGTLGNRVTGIMAPLYLGLDDPLERLNAERAAMQRVKASRQAELFDSMGGLSELLPPIIWEIASWPRPEMPRLPINLPQPAICSVISSNVVGPRQRLHLGGHELVDWQAAGICMLNIGLFVVFQSYADTASFSVTVDPNMIADEWVLIDQFRAALLELHEAADNAVGATRPRRARAKVEAH